MKRRRLLSTKRRRFVSTVRLKRSVNFRLIFGSVRFGKSVNSATEPPTEPNRLSVKKSLPTTEPNFVGRVGRRLMSVRLRFGMRSVGGRRIICPPLMGG
jgi:hypothetical protein